eukprot:Gb_35888 [translate_table: standard]
MDLHSREVQLSMPIPSISSSLHDSLRLQRYPRGDDQLRPVVTDLRSQVPRTSLAQQIQQTRSAQDMRPSEMQHAEEAPRNVDSSSRKGVRYRECRKNHAASIGGYAVDGCGEFMPGGEEGTTAALKCAACNCHRNFHRRELESETLCECHRTRRLGC